jgi:hypothetical protein
MEACHLPQDVELREPWRMKLGELQTIHKLWLKRQEQALDVFRFKSVLKGDQRDENEYIRAKMVTHPTKTLARQQKKPAKSKSQAGTAAESSAMGARGSNRDSRGLDTQSKKPQVKRQTTEKKYVEGGQLASMSGKGKEKATNQDDDDDEHQSQTA